MTFENYDFFYMFAAVSYFCFFFFFIFVKKNKKREEIRRCDSTWRLKVTIFNFYFLDYFRETFHHKIDRSADLMFLHILLNRTKKHYKNLQK